MENILLKTQRFADRAHGEQMHNVQTEIQSLKRRS